MTWGISSTSSSCVCLERASELSLRLQRGKVMTDAGFIDKKNHVNLVSKIDKKNPVNLVTEKLLGPTYLFPEHKNCTLCLTST